MRRFTKITVLVGVLAAVAAPVAMALAFVDSVNPPSGTVGTPYDFTFSSHSGCPPYRYKILSGSLPAGLTMSGEGRITGTPTQAGSSDFWVGLGDTCVTPETGAQRPFTINIGAKLTVTTQSLAPATVGVAYSVKFAADGGGSQTWSVQSGTLPAGLTFSADGTLSGTPSAALTAPVDIVFRVTDGTRTDTKLLKVDVVSPLAVTAPTLAPTENGHDLTSATVTATGGRAPYAWSLVGAPEWLKIDPASGAITGTPAGPGTFPFQISVKDAYGAAATVNSTATVKAKLAIKTAKLRATKVGKLYRAVLRTNGGVQPFVWKVTSGKFPVGIRLNRTTGVLGGTPRQAGSFTVEFTVSDSLGETQTQTLTLDVAAVKKKKKK
jgi:large repetitive protein